MTGWCYNTDIMAKKKNRKKHQFKYAAAKPRTDTATAGMGATAASPGESRPTPDISKPASRPATQPASDLAYVKRDVRKTVYLSAGFVAFQLLLWYAFTSSPLGPMVYSLIKV